MKDEGWSFYFKPAIHYSISFGIFYQSKPIISPNNTMVEILLIATSLLNTKHFYNYRQ